MQAVMMQPHQKCCYLSEAKKALVGGFDHAYFLRNQVLSIEGPPTVEC